MEEKTAQHPHLVRRAATKTIFLLKKIPLYEAIIAVLISLLVSFAFWIISSSRAQTNIVQPYYTLSASVLCNQINFEWRPQAQSGTLLYVGKNYDPTKDPVLRQDVSGKSTYLWNTVTPGTTYYAALYTKYYSVGNILTYTRRVSNIAIVKVPLDCPASLPDLVITGINLVSNVDSSNTQMSAGITIANQGKASTSSSFVVTLYPNQTYPPSCTIPCQPPLVCSTPAPNMPTSSGTSVTRPPLAAGTKDSFVISFIPPSPSGTYTGWVFADSTCQIKEQSETNNTKSFQYPVGKDTTPPTASIIQPRNSQVVLGKVEILATAKDNVAVKQVLFAVATQNNGTKWLTPDSVRNSNGYYSTFWDTTNIVLDTAAIYAAAQDTSGNYSQWARVWPVYVQNGNPVPTQTPTPAPKGEIGVSYRCSSPTMGVSATVWWVPRPDYVGTYKVFAQPSGVTDKNWRLLGETNQTQLGPLYGFSTNTNYDFMVVTPVNPEAVWVQIENQLTPSCPF